MNNDIDIIIDIETLGTIPGCPVIEIGACAVDTHTGEIFSGFTVRVNSGIALDVATATGLGTDPYADPESDFAKTCKWWMEDAERAEVLAAIMAPGDGLEHIGDALHGFRAWMMGHMLYPARVRVWANGPSFDIAIIGEACRANNIERPWTCRQERCVRTALDLAGHERGSIGWAEDGPRHRALPDARHEARKLWLSGALGEASAVALRLRQLGTIPAAPGTTGKEA